MACSEQAENDAVIVSPIECGSHPLSVFHATNVSIKGVQYPSFINYFSHRLLSDIGIDDEALASRLSEAEPTQAYCTLFNDVLADVFSKFSAEQARLLGEWLANYGWCLLYQFYLSRWVQDADFKQLLSSLNGHILVEVNADRIFGIPGTEAMLKEWFLFGSGRTMSKADILQFFSYDTIEDDSQPVWWGRNINGAVLMILQKSVTDGLDNSDAIEKTVEGFRNYYEHLKSTVVIRQDDESSTSSSSSAYESEDADDASSKDVWQQTSFNYFQCCKRTLSLRFLPLEDNFAPLSTSFVMPIVAGETLYPSIEHYVAALFLRDMNRLEAAKAIPTVESRNRLRALLVESTCDLPPEVILNWREEKMYSNFKVATELKFRQYPELKELLLLTGDYTLMEVNSFDDDWSIGMSWTAFKKWLDKERVTPSMVAFWLLHADYRPGIMGNNINGLLLMDIRRNLPESIKALRHEQLGRVIFYCPLPCSTEAGVVSSRRGSNDAVIVDDSSPLSSNFSAAFCLEDRCYCSVDAYINSQLVEHFGTDNLTGLNRNVVNAWLAKYGERLYERATEARLQQNSLCRTALLCTGEAELLVILSGDLAPSLKPRLGCFDGSTAAFVKWVEENRLSANFFRGCWSDSGVVPRLHRLGTNKLGLLLMKIRKSREQLEPPLDIYHCFAKPRVLWDSPNSPNVEDELFHWRDTRFSRRVQLTDHSQSPLSVFHLSPFVVSALTYYTVEHFYWFQVLLAGGFVDDPQHLLVLKNVLTETDPTKLRQLIFNTFPLDVIETCEKRLNKEAVYDLAFREKFSQNPQLLRALCDWTHPMLVASGESADLEVATSIMTNCALETWMLRWKIGTDTLMHWWMEDRLRPNNLGTNKIGLVLMRLREQYCTTFNVPVNAVHEMQPIELKDEKHCSFEGAVYVISAGHLLSPETAYPLTWEGKVYNSPAQLYWAHCCSALGLQAEEPRDFREVLKSSNCLEKFLEWRDSEAGSAAVHLCVELAFPRARSEAVAALMETASLPLAYCNDADPDLGIGMDASTLHQFCREVGADDSLLFRWLRHPAASPAALGRNLWCQSLMAHRHTLLRNDDAGKQPSGAVSSSALLRISSRNAASNFDQSVFYVSPYERLRRENSLCRVCYPWEQGDGDHPRRAAIEQPEDEEKKDVPNLLEAFSLIRDVDQIGSNLLKMLERSVFSGETNLLSIVTSDMEAFEMGRRIAMKFSEVVCPVTVDFKGMNSDDLYNLGRFIGFWTNGQPAAKESPVSSPAESS